ncbi:zf-DHHC-domain-containing protein [Neocallimastix sp. 'constans']|jgi:palmitoyltransferase
MGVVETLKEIIKSDLGKTFRVGSILSHLAFFFLIYLPISSQYFVFIPWLSQYKNSNLVWYILVPYNIIYVISFINYITCTLIDPGKVNKKITKEYLPSEYMTSMKGVKNEDFLRYKQNSSENVIEVENKIIKNLYDEKMWCSHCQSYKPPRAHHCSICKHCILKFDHHCIWINNCVGHRNLPFFIRFLFYISLLFTISFVLLFLLIKGYINFQDRYHSELYFPVTNVTPLMVIFMLINGILSFVLYCFILSMALYQIIYLVRNVTRIERIQVSRVAKLVERGTLEVSQSYPYDLGLFQNIEQVFGKKYWLWWLCSKPYGDGTEFPTNQINPIAVHWPPAEFILYEKYPYRTKEFYSGVVNGTIEPPPDMLKEDTNSNKLDQYQDHLNQLHYLTNSNLRKLTRNNNNNNNNNNYNNTGNETDITSMPMSMPMSMQPNGVPPQSSSLSYSQPVPSSSNHFNSNKPKEEDSDDSDNDALITILLRKKKEKQK